MVSLVACFAFIPGTIEIVLLDSQAGLGIPDDSILKMATVNAIRDGHAKSPYDAKVMVCT